jgi:hypothetical protein
METSLSGWRLVPLQLQFRQFRCLSPSIAVQSSGMSEVLLRTGRVRQRPAELSLAQFEAFRAILGNDFRPMQKRNGRVVRATPGAGNEDSQH